MTITVQNSAVLSDLAGSISDANSPTVVQCIALKAPLVGALTIGGLTQNSGAGVTWTIPPGSTGTQLPPGPSTGTAWGLRYSYSSGSDIGVAIAVWRAV